MKCLTSGIVLENHEIAENIFKSEILIPDIANQCLPGQFINIYFPDSTKIFPRPFSIAGVNDETIKLLYKVVGTQTRVMSQWKTGDKIQILGPLGNSFQYSEYTKNPVLLAGGVGAAPLMFLRDKMIEKGIRPKFFLGAQTKNQLPFIEDDCSDLIIATDDGSYGERGFVTEKYFEYINQFGSDSNVYVCGPDPMLKTLKSGEHPANTMVFVSLEKTMACGLGLCQGCIVKNTSKKDQTCYSLVCKDGPVFNLNDVELND